MSPARTLSAVLILMGFGSVLAACGGPSEPEPSIDAPDPVAEAGPDTAETTDPLMIEATGADPEDQMPDAEVEATNEDRDESEEQDHADDDHGHSGEHDHDHGHDHGDDGFVGHAHVHGEAEGALVLEGSTLTFSLNSALASFGADESEPETPQETAALEVLRTRLSDPFAMIDINDEAGCIFTGSDVDYIYSGGPGNADTAYTFNCASADGLTDITLIAFETFKTLEKVDLAVLSGADQAGVELNRETRTLSWPGN